jgi:hypothetical protein
MVDIVSSFSFTSPGVERSDKSKPNNQPHADRLATAEEGCERREHAKKFLRGS